ncbi:hypothetical protein LBMAG27_02880 [Bacteroidota bacterium]|nr:hypothetical protein LBMAG27_02880 [Bacteroidota bacterium]
MKKNLTLQSFVFAAFLFFANASQAQSLYFCEAVDKEGYAINESNTFVIGNNGGYFDLLVRLPYELKSYYVNYDIYEVKTDGSEIFSSTIRQDSQPEWEFFWKEMTFYDEGTYKIYVYDDNDYLLTSSTVKVKKQY